MNRSTHKTHNAAPCRGGFTMVELLVAIAIIVILLGLLLPTVSRLRHNAWAADSLQRINDLRTAIEQYYGDHKAYPGLFTNAEITSGVTPPIVRFNGTMGDLRFPLTMSENLVLSLMGGARIGGSSDPAATQGVLSLFVADVGRGAVNVNTLNPRRYPAYVSGKAIGIPDVPPAGIWDSWGDTNPAQPNTGGLPFDSAMAEPMDAFPDPMPILYVRARVGATAAAAANDNTAQYNYLHLGRYGFTNPNPGDFSGGDAAQRFEDYFTNSAMNSTHQRDGYILIGAGPDRKYGTADDQTNFGNVK